MNYITGTDLIDFFSNLNYFVEYHNCMKWIYKWKNFLLNGNYFRSFLNFQKIHSTIKECFYITKRLTTFSDTSSQQQTVRVILMQWYSWLDIMSLSTLVKPNLINQLQNLRK